MNPVARSAKQPGASGNELGALLKRWRGLRGKSQFDLSGDSGISQRHISFIESGRSIPSRHLLDAIAESLDVPLRERNGLLLAAGYAPIYADDGFEAVAMRGIVRALRRMLKHHEPYPAVVLDRYWNVVMANDAAPKLFACFTDLEAFQKPRNLLKLVFDPNGLRPHIGNWDNVAKSLIQRVHRESIGRVVDDKTKALIAALSRFPEVRLPSQSEDSLNNIKAMPVVPITFIRDGQAISYFSLIATVGTPQTVAAQELRIECMFPPDERSEKLHLELIGSASRPEDVSGDRPR